MVLAVAIRVVDLLLSLLSPLTKLVPRRAEFGLAVAINMVDLLLVLLPAWMELVQ